MKAFYEKNSAQIFITHGHNLNFPPHLHKEVEIVFCLKGSIILTCNQSTYTLNENDVMYVFPNSIHSHACCDHSEYLICITPADSFPMFKKTLTKECIDPVLTEVKTKQLLPLFHDLYQEYSTSKDNQVMFSYLQLILALSFQQMQFREKKPQLYEDILPDILNYVEENYTSPLNADAIAGNFGINPSYLSRLISSRLNCTLTEYIHELRINYAKHLLQHSAESITQIVYECGFQTQRSFNRVFLKLTGQTPREYKRELEKGEK